MPKDPDRRNDIEMTQEELEQQDKFRTFFTTSVAQVPDELVSAETSNAKHGLLARFFAKKERDAAPPPAAAEQPPAEPQAAPTGEILLGSGGEEEGLGAIDAGLLLDEQPEPPIPPIQEEKAPPAQPAPAQPAPAEKAPRAAAAAHGAQKSPSRRPDSGDMELQRLKSMLDTMGVPPAQPSARPESSPARPAPEAARPAAPPKAQPEAPQEKEITREVEGFRFFGVGEDEAPRGAAAPTPDPEDTMSIELHEETPPAAQPAQPVQEKASRHEKTAEMPGKAAPSEAPQTPEETQQALEQTAAALNLRCALSGILAAALLWLGLIYEGLLPALPGLDPAAAPAAFMGANLLLLAAALAVSRSIMWDGLLGLVRRPSLDTMPALAAAAALLQSVTALLNAAVYQSTSLTLMSGAAAFALFMDNLGSRLLVCAVRDGSRLVNSGVEHLCASRTRDKNLLRCLGPALEEKDPWILLSRPLGEIGGFVDRCFSQRDSERKAQLFSRILLACGCLGGVWMLVTGKGPNAACAALAAILCLGAPLSATLIAGLASLRMERTAGAVGAVIPGWAAVEELNGIDTVRLDASELFTPESAQLEDIRIFKGGRIDRAILYAAGVLGQSCNTLSGLFRVIVEDRADILPPVKDLERRPGLGFAAWCGNNRILIGTRRLMEQEGVTLPEAAYEAQHSQNGALQILYLAVSGELYAMFVLRYVGGKHAAHGLSILKKEGIRLLVTCEDPSLTADKIAAAYRLPEGLVTVLDGAQSKALDTALAAEEGAPCCMIHLRGLASLTGGLRAAQRAQAAETLGTTVQLVSAGFSALIGLLLSYSGSIGTLSLVVVLMYQAAWSALSIAAAAAKQRG